MCHGWVRRQLQLSSAQRLERLLPVLSFAYLFLSKMRHGVLLPGLVCRERLSPKHGACAVSKKKHLCSAFVIGRYMYGEITFPLAHLLLTFRVLVTQLSQQHWR